MSVDRHHIEFKGGEDLFGGLGIEYRPGQEDEHKEKVVESAVFNEEAQEFFKHY